MLESRLARFLVVFMFVSKLSARFIPGVPYSFSYLIYQGGVHPYLNFVVNGLIGGLLVFLFARKRFDRTLSNRDVVTLSPVYVVFTLSLATLLAVQTLMQIVYVHPSASLTMQLGGLALALWLILVYGVVIPCVLPLRDFLTLARRVSVLLVTLSLVMLPIFGVALFRGGRFAGVFKHIPHMVACATFGFILLLPLAMGSRRAFSSTRPLATAGAWVGLLLCGSAILLTGTRAALVTMGVTFLGALFLYGPAGRGARIFKAAFASAVFAGLVGFAPDIATFLGRIFRGQEALVNRQAQDGIASRFEEVTRGLEYFEQSPHFGLGIVYRFLQQNESLDSYNADKDPHNFFVSAAVVGGWPLLALSIAAAVLMTLGAMKGLLRANESLSLCGLFIAAHLPVFFIYHIHLSLGGLADRFYWVIWGYLALRAAAPTQVLPVNRR